MVGHSQQAVTELYRQPSRTSQDQQLAAPSISAAFPPNSFPFAQIMYLRDKRLFYMRVGGPVGGGAFTGVAVWELIGGPGASLAWPKYVVNVAGQQPVAPYNLVQAAIDAAVADGHDTANPTVVAVFPGTYVQDIVFAPGVFVVGMDNSVPSQIRLVGAHTVPGTVALANYKAVNVVLVGTPGNAALTVAGALVCTVDLQDWSILADGAPAIQVTNTAMPVISLTDGIAQWINPPAGGLIDLSAGGICELVAQRCQFVVNAFTEIAIKNLGGSNLRLRDCTVLGRTQQSIGTLQSQQSNWFAFTQAVIDGTFGAVVDMSFDNISHAAAGAAWFSVGGGGATLTANALRFLDNRVIDPAAGQTTSFFHYARASSLVVGSIALFQAVDGVKVDSNGVASVVTLPPLGSVPLNHQLFVKWARDPLGSVSVAPFGAENIEDVPAAIFLAGQGASLRFEADQANGTWWVIA